MTPFSRAIIFKSLRATGTFHGWLAQLAEQRTLNPWVQGSIPWPPIFALSTSSKRC